MFEAIILFMRQQFEKQKKTLATKALHSIVNEMD